MSEVDTWDLIEESFVRIRNDFESGGWSEDDLKTFLFELEKWE